MFIVLIRSDTFWCEIKAIMTAHCFADCHIIALASSLPAVQSVCKSEINRGKGGWGRNRVFAYSIVLLFT